MCKWLSASDGMDMGYPTACLLLTNLIAMLYWNKSIIYEREGSGTGYWNQDSKLFTEWHKESGEKIFVQDGVICEEEYENSNPKIVFLLKETNKLDTDLRTFLRTEPPGATWNNVSRWSWGIRNVWNDMPALFEEVKDIDMAFRIKELKTVAVVNVKKTPGGSSTIAKEQKEHTAKNSEWLIKQLDIYNPDIVVCGAVSYPLEKELKKQLKAQYPDSDGYLHPVEGSWCHKDGERIVIYFKHPNARRGAEKSYQELIDTVREIRRK